MSEFFREVLSLMAVVYPGSFLVDYMSGDLTMSSDDWAVAAVIEGVILLLVFLCDWRVKAKEATPTRPEGDRA